MATSYPQFVLLGDSLFQQSVEHRDGFSFHAAILSLCVRKMDVVNRGLSGWNTNNVLKYMDDIFHQPNLTTPKIKYLAILLGANDACLPWSPTKQHCPIEQYKINLVKIINHPTIKAHNPKILLITPPPLDELKHEVLDKARGLKASTREQAVSTKYAEKVREVARENPDVVLVDLWKAIMVKAIYMADTEDYIPGGPWLGSPENGKSGGLDSLLPDGIHMSGEAYRIFFETIRPHIGTEWANLEPEAGFVYPTWQEVTASEPGFF